MLLNLFFQSCLKFIRNKIKQVKNKKVLTEYRVKFGHLQTDNVLVW